MKVYSFFRLLLTLLSLLLLAACGGSPSVGSDETEKDHPTILEAKEKVKLQDPDGAIAILEDFLREQPEFAYAHLQLGFAFQIKQEPVKALYHFQIYLEQRPESRNAETVRLVVRDELKRLATRVGVAGPTATEDEFLELEEKLRETRRELLRVSILLEQAGGNSAEPQGWGAEKLELMAEIERLKAQGRTRPDESNVRSGPSSETPSTPSAQRTYVVQRGDNLSLISKKMYGRSSEWQKIYDANRTVLPSTRALKPGMELVIPE